LGLREVRVAVLATVSAQVLRPFLVVEGAARGLRVRPWFAPFGQLEEQALDANGGLYAERPEVVLVLARLEELMPEWTAHFLADSVAAQQKLAVATDRLRALLAGLRQRTSAIILTANFSSPARLIAGMADPMLEPSQAGGVQQANDALAAACRAVPGAFVFDYAQLVAEHGWRAWHDARLFALARQPWTVAAQIALGRRLARALRAALVAPAKCLVLDADNTLWGGVLGEDGPGGIALGDEYPGSVFKTFQKYLRTLKDRGVLLALASKNDEAELIDVLERHPDGVLRREDFAAVRINWQEKSANLRALADELHLGLDALVFFDDSPFERDEVRRRVPMVTVLEVPADPLHYIDAIEESGVFDQLALSAEDRQRSGFFQAEKVRAEASEAVVSREEFFASLEMVATIGRVGAETLPRVAQLLAKTNQFNLTTRRHGAAEIAAMIEAGSVALWLRLADRFGDHGLVGVGIARETAPGRWIADSLLLSCRVIGRGAEDALLAQLAGCIAARGGTELIGEYMATARNALVADFFPQHGFTPCGAGQWKRNLAGAAIPFPPSIRVQFHD